MRMRNKCFATKCFANIENRCRILNNTDFGCRECPFFKTRGEFLRGRAEYPYINYQDVSKRKNEEDGANG